MRRKHDDDRGKEVTFYVRTLVLVDEKLFVNVHVNHITRAGMLKSACFHTLCYVLHVY